MTEQLFHVRRYKCPDGSFEWYVLNSHTRRRVGKPFVQLCDSLHSGGTGNVREARM
jgi:hypothetical protein